MIEYKQHEGQTCRLTSMGQLRFFFFMNPYVGIFLYINLRAILFLLDRCSFYVGYHFLIKNQLLSMIVSLLKIRESKERKETDRNPFMLHS